MFLKKVQFFKIYNAFVINKYNIEIKLLLVLAATNFSQPKINCENRRIQLNFIELN